MSGFSSSSTASVREVSERADAVYTYVHDRRDEFVSFVRRLAQMESPSTDPNAHRDVQEVLASALAHLGFATTHLPGTDTGGALYACPREREEGAACQLLLGHEDTVWEHGTLRDMPVTENKESLSGPGVFDMKGGLASIVFALRAIAALDHPLPATPLVLVTSDEEIGSPESRRHVERLARVSSRVFVAEPALGTEGKIKTARKGTGELELKVRATEAAPGDDVVLELSRLVQRLNDLNDVDRGVTVNVGVIDAEQEEDTGPHEGCLSVDLRVPTQAEAHELEAAIRDFKAEMPGLTLDIRGGFHRPPMERTEGTARLWQDAERLGRQLGLDLEEGRSGGASDGNFTSQHAATLDGLGAVGGGAHADHEFLDVDRTLDRCALLALLLLTPIRGS